MLILIAGITGSLGQKLALSAIKRGAQVRGLGRSPNKLGANVSSQLESFTQSSSWYDSIAIDKAVTGVDAVICAYQGIPELQLEGQLLLLRAAERAGVKIFHASTWNYDWRRLKLGQQASYDPYISLHRHVQLSSTIKPIYALCGVLAEVLFSAEGRAFFGTAQHGPWDHERKCVELCGTGDEKYQWTTEADAAEFSVAVVMSDKVKDGSGGFYLFCSGEHSMREIAQEYARVRGRDVPVKVLGDVHQFEQEAAKARDEAGPTRWYEYIGYYYQLYTIQGIWNLTEFDDIPGVKRTTLEEFLLQFPAI